MVSVDLSRVMKKTLRELLPREIYSCVKCTCSCTCKNRVHQNGPSM